MDGLDDFEKSLAAEKAERDRAEERKHRKQRHYHRVRSEDRDHHSHRHRHHGHRSRSRDRDTDDGHRSKRSRQLIDGDESRRKHRSHGHLERDSDRRSHAKTSDPKEDLPLPDEEIAGEDSIQSAGAKKAVRDNWMTDFAALGVDYTQRGARREKTPPPKQEPRRAIHSQEINAGHLQDINDGRTSASNNIGLPAQHETDYRFGDEGSNWRMTNLKSVYDIAQRTGRSLDDVAIERYGDLHEFDDAREEKMELDRRSTYGEGYVGKDKPSGELYQERKLSMGIGETRHSKSPGARELDQGMVIPDSAMSAPKARLDQTTLNKMRANMMKAKLRKAPDAAKLEEEYNEAAATFAAKDPEAIVLNVMENRLLAGYRGEAKAVDNKRGRERGTMEENNEMTIEDMVREERRTRGQAGGESLRLAERIAKDGKFDNDLDYMDENAEKLAKRIQKSEINLKNTAVSQFQKINKILDRCQLCHHEDTGQPPVAPVISLGTRAYLTLPTEPELSDGGAVVVPIQHRTNLLECDDDEWEEIRNFMKCLTRMYHDQGREVIFYENATAPHRHMHAAMQAVPIPYDQGDTAPAFFKEAMLSADEEWSQHKKIIDTGAKARSGVGKLAFRRSIAKEMPYFHAWFSIDGGLGHVVEDSNRWPKGDLFAREILGGMLDSGPDVIKKQGRWHKADPRAESFKKRWRKFDWTRVLADG